jgi:putative membrane protein
MAAERTGSVASGSRAGDDPPMRPDWPKLIFSWAVNTVAVWFAAWVLGGVVVDDALSAVVAGAVLGVVNAYVKPVLTVLGIPFIILTLGIGLFLINMAMVALTAWIVPGFTVTGFWPDAKATIVIWIVNAVLSGLWPDERRPDRYGPASDRYW